MDDILGRVAAILAAAFVFLGIPITYMQERAKSAEQMYLLSLDTEFVDQVCSVGFLTMETYSRFLQEVASLPGIHEVKIMHEKKEIVLEDEVYSYQSTFYDETDILEVLKTEKQYTFAKGDYVKVILTADRRITFLPWQKDATTNVFYGGTVRYEDF